MVHHLIHQQERFFEKGWLSFPYDPVLDRWVAHALPWARKAVYAPENARWFRYRKTWFVGVNALPNNNRGAVENGPALDGIACRFLRAVLGVESIGWDRAQVSVCYPGYPKRSDSEKQSAFQYRMNRDAAHVDGLLPEGRPRKRFLREYHHFILGIPMVEIESGASPFVLWEGSHEIIRAAFKERYANVAVERWRDTDITEVYHAVRNRIFESCRRVEIVVQPGQAYLAHRLVLHGMSPWNPSAGSGADGRMICYFRPDMGSPLNWLEDP